jgi:gluconate:H+ symporter, GntP family
MMKRPAQPGRYTMPPPPADTASLLLCTALGVAGLIVLVAKFRLNAFIALVLASVFVGLCSGMPLGDIARSFQDGVGATLGFVAVVVGLGAILGKMLAESGGADVVARALAGALGERRMHWAMMFAAFLVGLPVFFTVGLVLLAPIVFTIARKTGTPILFLGIPLVAGLSVSHGLVPPHPGPLAAIERLGADTGTTIFYSLIIGLPTAIVAGPLFGAFISRRVQVEVGGIGEQMSARAPHVRPPGLGITLFTILLPVLLMLLATLADMTLGAGNSAREWMVFIGSPLIAMLLAVLLAFYVFGAACGFDRRQILTFSEECVGPIANVLLVVGAGGGFGRVLSGTGVDLAIVQAVQGLQLSPLLLGWTVAALLRVTVGSATVAITTAASLMAPVAAAVPGTNPELLVIALGAGSLIASHLNDGGFWLVKEYFNMTVQQTLLTWTVMETIIAVVALVLVLLVNWAVTM